MAFPLPISLLTLFQLLLVTLYLSPTYAEPQTHLVYVGVNGSFFSPSTIPAQVDDTVSFIFSGDVHAVRQSTFQKPCTPLDGGFSSGLAGINGTSSTSEHTFPVWNLTISNTSAPLYFMCDSINPVFHCSAGMVGIINSPNSTHFDAFAAAARQTNFTPTATPSVIIGGIQGAYATAAPSTTSQSSQPTVATVSDTASPQSAGHPSNVGPIAGGVIGGLALLAFVVWLVVKQSRRKQVLMLDRFTFKKPPGPEDGFEQIQYLPHSKDLQRVNTRETMLSEIDLEKTPADRFRRKHSFTGSVHSVHSTHTTHSVQPTRRQSLHRSNSRSSLRSQRRASRVEAVEPPLPSPPAAVFLAPTPTSVLPPSPTYPPPSPGLDPLSPGPDATDFQVTTASRAVSVYSQYAPVVEPFVASTPTMPSTTRQRPNIPPPIISPTKLMRQSQIPPPPITPSPAYSFDDPNPAHSLPAPPVPALPVDAANYLKRAESSSSSMSRSKSRKARERQEREDAEKFQRKLMMMGPDGTGVAPRATEDSDKEGGLPEYNDNQTVPRPPPSA